MKKIVVIMMILVIPLITVEKVNNKNYYLETETDTYTKEEIDSKINELKDKIDSNSTSIIETKSILTEIKNKLNDYALKTSLNKTNEDIENLLALANNNAKRIDELGNKIIEDPTKVGATSRDTHKGIVYLDPTDLTKTCTIEQAENNVNENGTPTEIKTGCMKWYIYSEDESNYTMILDHNTTAKIRWNDDNKNVAYEQSNVYPLVQDLSVTSGWKYIEGKISKPRLITVDEINKIIGIKHNMSLKSSFYYFDTKAETVKKFTESVRSNYDWLFNNLNECKTGSIDFGCNIEDSNEYTLYGTSVIGKTWGYWTSTTCGAAGDDSDVSAIFYRGSLINGNASRVDIGIRPVITISKSIIK